MTRFVRLIWLRRNHGGNPRITCTSHFEWHCVSALYLADSGCIERCKLLLGCDCEDCQVNAFRPLQCFTRRDRHRKSYNYPFTALICIQLFQVELHRMWMWICLLCCAWLSAQPEGEVEFPRHMLRTSIATTNSVSLRYDLWLIRVYQDPTEDLRQPRCHFWFVVQIEHMRQLCVVFLLLRWRYIWIRCPLSCADCPRPVMRTHRSVWLVETSISKQPTMFNVEYWKRFGRMLISEQCRLLAHAVQPVMVSRLRLICLWQHSWCV